MACIAKAPSERPTTAALLARAAQALRRGDVLAAASAVPAVLPAGVAAPTMAMQAEGATTVLPTQAPGFETTLLGVPAAGAAAAGSGYGGTPPTGAYPATNAVATDPEEGRRRRSPWTWPLIALILLLVIVLVAWAVSQFAASNAGAKTSASTSTSASASASASSTASSTASGNVTINIADYVGKPYAQVVSNLQSLGLSPTAQKGDAAPTDGDVGNVYELSKSGSVPKGSSITVTYYGDTATAQAPSSAPVLSSPSSQPVPANSTITVSWPAYNACPAGQSRSGYSVNVTGAPTSPQNPEGPNATEITIPTGDPGSGPITVKYKVFCGAKDSAYSPTLTVQVAKPAPTPTPTTPAPTPSGSAGLPGL
jgi:serine/threonine-protein kinase